MNIFNRFCSVDSKNRKEAIKDSNSGLRYLVNEVYTNIASDMTHFNAVKTEFDVNVNFYPNG
jgi:hypothetical protein